MFGMFFLLFVMFDWPDRLFVAYDDQIDSRRHQLSRVVGGNGRGGRREYQSDRVNTY